MATPLVSLITINYDHLADTIEFLESASKLRYPNIEVIVVDNDSPKEKPGKDVKERFSSVQFIQSDRNRGFAGGNNLGLAAAKGDYLFLLNNDTVMAPDFLDGMVAFMESHPDAGLASPKVMYPDGVTIQYAGARAINPVTGRGKRLGLYEKDDGQYDYDGPTDLGHGAALIVRRSLYDTIGPMPEVFFLYYEEHDWTEQAKRKGFKMYYVGTSNIVHKESISTGGDESPLKVYYMTRNRVLFMRRNVSGFQFFLGLVFFALVATPRAVLKYIGAGKVKLLRAYFRGVLWNFSNPIG